MHGGRAERTSLVPKCQCLMLASERGQVQIMQICWWSHAHTFDWQDGSTCLMLASERGQVQVVEYLVGNGYKKLLKETRDVSKYAHMHIPSLLALCNWQYMQLKICTNRNMYIQDCNASKYAHICSWHMQQANKCTRAWRSVWMHTSKHMHTGRNIMSFPRK